MSQTFRIETFWAAYLSSRSEQDRPGLKAYDIWHFGATEDVAAECAHLVKARIKTATSGLVWEMEADGETADILFKNADTAMFKAKGTEKRVVLFRESAFD